MTRASKILSGVMLAAGIGTVYAQATAPPAAPPPVARATISDPEGPLPNAASVPFTLPKDIKWTGEVGRQQTAILYGDPTREGPYGVLYRWYAGNFSRPHFHDQTRWIYVVSGTWWISTSTVFDERTTYPMHAGTVVVNAAGKVHWDGARTGEKELAVLVLTGMGPVKTTQVDAQGNPMPPVPPAAPLAARAR